MSGRVVLVSGGSRGIGRACAERFAADGDRVVVTYHRSPPPPGDEARPLIAKPCDVTDPEAVEALFVAVEAELGPVEVLVVAAGVTDDALLIRMTEQRWAAVIETDLTACFRITKRAIGPMLRARSGRVVLISSVVAMSGNPGQSNYAAAKAGMIGFARSLAREVASRTVTVNVVAPGLVATDMLAAIGESRIAEMTAAVPLGRVAEADEIAATVAFLASKDAAYVTGAVIPVDGGLGMGH